MPENKQRVVPKYYFCKWELDLDSEFSWELTIFRYNLVRKGDNTMELLEKLDIYF